VGLLVLSGIWAFMARRSGNLRHRAASAATFQHLLLGFAIGFSYLLFHEGGHALGEIAFGRFDLARSDFWGIHGHPHSGGISGPPLAPWQQSVISGGGPLLPTFAGWVLFLLCGSRSGRSFRGTRPMVNLYLLAIAVILIVPWFTTAGLLLGILGEDGDWHGFMAGVPGPQWFIEGLIWGTLLVNAFVLVRIAPVLWRAWKQMFLPTDGLAPAET
jgi:hypothetical protein